MSLRRASIRFVTRNRSALSYSTSTVSALGISIGGGATTKWRSGPEDHTIHPKTAATATAMAARRRRFARRTSSGSAPTTTPVATHGNSDGVTAAETAASSSTTTKGLLHIGRP